MNLGQLHLDYNPKNFINTIIYKNNTLPIHSSNPINLTILEEDFNKIISKIQDNVINELTPEVKEQITIDLKNNLKPHVFNNLKLQFQEQATKDLKLELKQHVIAILKSELRDKVKNTLKTELTETVTNEIKSELYDSIKTKLQNELRNNVINDLHSELQQTVTTELRKQLTNKVINTLRLELTDTVTHDLRNDLHASVISNLRIELREKVQNELKTELTNTVIRTLQTELKDKIVSDLRNELQNKVINDLRNELHNVTINNLRNELHTDVVNNLRNELHTGVVNDLRNELRKKVHHNLHSELKDTAITNLRSELKDQVINKLKDELRDNVLNKLKDELNEHVFNQLKIDLHNTAIIKLKDDLHDKVINELKYEMRDNVIDELKEELHTNAFNELINNFHKQIKFEEFTNRGLKKIVNVYQLTYINGTSTGIGDFLRGCFCFMQFAKLLNLEFDIDVSNHPIAKYIENSQHINGLNYDTLERLDNQNIIDFSKYEISKSDNINDDFVNTTITWLNLQSGEVCGFYSNAFPFFKTHTQRGKNFINSKLQPNEFMKSYIQSSLNELNLIKKQYEVIHIRSGDEHAFKGEKQLTKAFINKIKIILNQLIKQDKKYFLISDSNVVKNQLKIYSNFYMFNRDIEHLGGDGFKSDDTDGVLNTMLDYYLMSYSNSIISLTVYEHISGFSKYCSILHNIPFQYIKITH